MDAGGPEPHVGRAAVPVHRRPDAGRGSARSGARVARPGVGGPSPHSPGVLHSGRGLERVRLAVRHVRP